VRESDRSMVTEVDDCNVQGIFIQNSVQVFWIFNFHVGKGSSCVCAGVTADTDSAVMSVLLVEIHCDSPSCPIARTGICRFVR
jgi:hypothetical protein